MGVGLMDLCLSFQFSEQCIHVCEYVRPVGLVFCACGMWVPESVFSFLDRVFTLWIFKACWDGNLGVWTDVDDQLGGLWSWYLILGIGFLQALQ